MDNCFAAKRFFPSCLFCFALLISQLTKLFTLWLERPDLSFSFEIEIRLCPLYLFFHTQFFALFDFQWAWSSRFMNSNTYPFGRVIKFLVTFVTWLAQVDSNHRPRAYQARALTCWAMRQYEIGRSVTENWTTNRASFRNESHSSKVFVLVYFQTTKITLMISTFSIERRWSSRTFRYGYLVTT